MEAYLSRTLCLFFVVVPVQICGIESFCIATSVSVGGTASISCHFSEDLSKSPEGQKDVHVYLFKVLADTDPKLVFYYQFVNGMPRIEHADGYDYKNNLTDHLEIVIYNATKKHAGLYKCSVIPSDKHRASLCSLKVNEDSHSVLTENSTATTTNYPDLHSSDSTVNGNAVERDDANETEKVSTTIILAAVIPILLILTAVILFILYKKRKRQRDRRRQLPIIEMDQPAHRNDVPENNTGVPQNGFVNGHGTSDEGEGSNVLLPGESHPGHDEPTHDNNETLSLTKEEED